MLENTCMTNELRIIFLILSAALLIACETQESRLNHASKALSEGDDDSLEIIEKLHDEHYAPASAELAWQKLFVTSDIEAGIAIAQEAGRRGSMFGDIFYHETVLAIEPHGSEKSRQSIEALREVAETNSLVSLFLGIQVAANIHPSLPFSTELAAKYLNRGLGQSRSLNARAQRELILLIFRKPEYFDATQVNDVVKDLASNPNRTWAPNTHPEFDDSETLLKNLRIPPKLKISQDQIQPRLGYGTFGLQDTWRPDQVLTPEAEKRLLLDQLENDPDGRVHFRLYQHFRTGDEERLREYQNDTALMHLRLAASAGLPAAIRTLGINEWHSGQRESARTLLTRAALEGDIEAASYLAHLMLLDAGDKDYETIKFWHTLSNIRYLDWLAAAEAASQQLLLRPSNQQAETTIRLDAKGIQSIVGTTGLPEASYLAIGGLSLASIIFLIYLAAITHTSGAGDLKSQLVARVMFLESLLIFIIFLPQGLPFTVELNRAVQSLPALIGVLFSAAAVTYLALSAEFPSRYSRWATNKNLRYAVFALLTLSGFAFSLWIFEGNLLVIEGRNYLGMRIVGAAREAAIVLTALLILHIYNLLVLLDSSRSKELQGSDRSTAESFTLAYALRFTFLSAGVVYGLYRIAIFYLYEENMHPSSMYPTIFLYLIGEISFALLFSFGVLRSQMFGVALLFRKGTARAILAGLAFMVFFIIESFLERFVESEIGQVGAIAVALGVVSLHSKVLSWIDPMLLRMFPSEDLDALHIKFRSYVELFKIASADSTISEDERKMLNSLAASLSMTKEEQTTLEDQYLRMNT